MIEVHIQPVEQTEDLASFFTQQVKHVDYCYEVTSKEFHREVIRDDRYTDACLLVARQDAEVVGFAHLGLRTAEGEPLPFGVIRFLSFQPQERAVGNLLLQRAEDYFADWNPEAILAFSSTSYNFYRFGLAAQSAQLSHIGALLGIHGYQRRAQNKGDPSHYVLMHNCSVGMTKPPRLPDGYDIQPGTVTLDTMNLFTVSLQREGNKLGECFAHSLSESNAAEVAHAVYYVRHLEIDKSVRGQGLGRCLMAQMHWQMQQSGHDTAVLYTAYDNYRAQLLYSSMGYHIIDSASVWHKGISQIGVGADL